MPSLNVEIWDATGNKRIAADLPDDVEVERVLAVLMDKLRLPKYNPTGEFMSYKLQSRRQGMQLLGQKTLSTQGVQHGDVLIVVPELTAG